MAYATRLYPRAKPRGFTAIRIKLIGGGKPHGFTSMRVHDAGRGMQKANGLL